MQMPGQWWERMGTVVFLHPVIDPNSDPAFQGWVKVTVERARQVLRTVEAHRVIRQELHRQGKPVPTA